MEIVVLLIMFLGWVAWGTSAKSGKSNVRPKASKKPSGLKTVYRTVPAKKKRFPQSPQDQNRPKFPKSMEIKGRAYVIDGDTISIGGTKIRLAGIDAPELDMPWGQKSKWAMVAICSGQTITAELDGERSYDRLVGTCFLPDGRDIGAELIKTGLALDLPQYSRGKYRCFEPEGARKRLCNGKFGHASIRLTQRTEVRVGTFQK